MDLINYEIGIAYQKADFKVKAEKTSSSYEKNRLYLHFLSYFTLKIFLFANVLLQKQSNCFLSNQCSSQNCLQQVDMFSTFKIVIEC